MCGIAGIWKTPGRVAPAEIKAMADAMVHRGPDSWGYAYGDSSGARPVAIVHGDGPAPTGFDFALGHRRLSIIELSDKGRQPMALGPLTVVYNGEIYNYIELAEELRGLGHDFASHSDTEVLLHAWAEWGTACVEKLNGIFAFLMWNAATRTLYAVRDRIGVKPLYYFRDAGQMAFASEIKPLLAVREGRPEPDGGLMYDFLTVGRMDHEEGTLFRGIRRLPAGCCMAVTRDGVQTRRYWNLAERLRQPPDTFPEAAEQFHDLFHDAIRLQMRADVPVASCLSGGLDSSSVVAVASTHGDTPMQTFTARFEDKTMDEWEWAAHVHRQCRVEAIPVWADPKAFWNELPDLIRSQEEPIANPGVFAQWQVMKAIRERGIRVTLDGQGGDELLCGYAKYFYWSLMELVRQGRLLSAGRAAADGVLRGGAHLFSWGDARRYLPWGLGVKSRGAALLRPDFAGCHGDRRSSRGKGIIRDQQIGDVDTYSLPVLLRYEDKNSMAHSIEARVPFLDHRLVEACIALPTDMKIRGSLTKRVLRRGLARDVPGPILQRRSKLGFGGTYRSWAEMLRGELRKMAADESRPVFRIVDPAGFRHWIEQGDPAAFRVAALDTWLTAFGLMPGAEA